MNTSTFALLAIAGAAIAAVYATEPCDMSAIEGKLLPNGTAWHESCTAATGTDVFTLESFPTTAEAKNISQSRDCVNYLNQLNQQANTLIQCETTVGNQTINLAELLTDLLKGETGNKTKEVGSSSMSGSVSLSASGSASASADKSASHSTAGSVAVVSNSSESSSSGKTSSKSAGVAVTATFSVVAAAATTVLAFAL